MARRSLWRLILASGLLFGAGPLFAQPEIAASAASTSARRRSAVHGQKCESGVLVTQGGIGDVVVDGSHVFFGDDSGRVQRVARTGGTPELLARVAECSVTFLAADADRLYFHARSCATGLDSVYAVAKNGDGATPLLRDLQSAWEMIPDGEWLYLITLGSMTQMPWPATGRILRVRKDGSATETIASNLGVPMGMVIDGDTLYFTEAGTSLTDPSGGVRRVSKNGGAITTVATLRGAWALAQDETTLYVLDGSGGELNGVIRAVSKLDGSTRQLAGFIAFELIEPMAVYGGTLYFMDLVSAGRARIEALPVTGGDRRTVAEFAWSFPQFAVDGCAVYYGTAAGLQRTAH